MATKTKMLFGGNVVDAEELEFDPVQERWNEYRLEDGTMVKIRLVVSKVIRLNIFTAEGDPIYHVLSGNVLSAFVPIHLKSLGNREE